MVSKLTRLTKKAFQGEFFASVVSFEAFVKGLVSRFRLAHVVVKAARERVFVERLRSVDFKEHDMTTKYLAGALAAALVLAAHPVVAQDKGKTAAAEITSEAQTALKQLYATAPLAKVLGPKAHAILVFPKVTKAGLGIGGQYGEGVLLKGGTAVAYYKTTGASFGLQAGGQQYGYAMIFMNAKALEQLDNKEGFEVGVGPSVVLVDEGMAKTTTTTTLKDDIYAFVFGQKGLMAGLGIQGNKITRITPK